MAGSGGYRDVSAAASCAARDYGGRGRPAGDAKSGCGCGGGRGRSVGGIARVPLRGTWVFRVICGGIRRIFGEFTMDVKLLRLPASCRDYSWVGGAGPNPAGGFDPVRCVGMWEGYSPGPGGGTCGGVIPRG